MTSGTEEEGDMAAWSLSPFLYTFLIFLGLTCFLLLVSNSLLSLLPSSLNTDCLPSVLHWCP